MYPRSLAKKARFEVHRGVHGRGSYPLDESFYSKRSREQLVEQDALTPEEAGFMTGYQDDLFEDSLVEDKEELS